MSLAAEEVKEAPEARAARASWARSLPRVGVVACVVGACLTLVVYYPRAIRYLGRTARANSSLSFQDRAIAGGNSVVANQDVLVYARALIPRDATYRVVMGQSLPKAKRDLALYVPDYFRYYLMPRRPSDSASWVICYGCDRTQLGGRFDVVADTGDDIAIGRLAR